MNVRILLVTAAIAAVLLGCAGLDSGPGTGKEAVPNGIKTEIRQKEPPAVSEARRLIQFGTPETIVEGVRILQDSPAINSQAGERLFFAGRALYTLAYPRLEFPFAVKEPEEGDRLLLLYRDAVRGVFSPDLESWDVFLELIITSFAVLNSNDADILILGGLAAQAAGSQNVPSVLPDLVLGITAEKQGLLETAAVRYRLSLGIGERCYPARLGLVRVLNAQEKYQETLPHLDILTERFPGDQNLAFLRAEILNTLRRYDQVQAAVALIEERFGGSVDQSRILLLDAARLLGMNKPREALNVLEPALNEETVSTEILIAAGRAAADAGDPGLAVEYLETAVARGGASAAARELLFRTAVAAALWDRAEPLVNEVLAVSGTPAVRYAAARLYLETGAVTESLELSQPLYRNNPKNPDYFLVYIRGLLLANQGEKALPLIEQELVSIEDRQVRSQLHYLAGRLYSSRTRRIEAFQAALFENMKNTSALIALSDEFAAIGEYLKAYRYMKQAQALLPENRSVRLRMEELEVLIE